ATIFPIPYLGVTITTPTRPTASPFPYPTLFRSLRRRTDRVHPLRSLLQQFVERRVIAALVLAAKNKMDVRRKRQGQRLHGAQRTDRKSTRLNSSHLGISYAVFCLKKKK